MEPPGSRSLKFIRQSIERGLDFRATLPISFMRRYSAMVLLSSHLAAMSFAATPLSWVWRAPLAGSMSALAFSSGRFVAGGPNGALKVSNDGVVWEPRESGTTLQVDTLRAVNGRLFAFAGVAAPSPSAGVTLTSTEGDTWVRLGAAHGLSSGQSLCDVVWTGSRFVGLGFDWAFGVALSATSPDGLVWQVTRSSIALLPRRLAAGAGRFVGVASTLGGSGSFALASDNGADWIAHPLPVPTLVSAQPVDVTFGGGLFAAVGRGSGVNFVDNAGFIATSVDGKSWTDRTLAGTIYRLQAVAFANGRFVAVGDAMFDGLPFSRAPAAYSSSDGQTWVRDFSGIETSRREMSLRAIAGHPDGFLAAGDGDLTLRWNGVGNWTRLDPGLDGLGVGVYARGEFWFATTGAVLSTVDGTVWSRHPLLQPPVGDNGPITALGPMLDLTLFRGLTYSGQAFIGVTMPSTLSPGYLRSPDGVTWTGGSFPVGQSFNDIATGVGVVAAVGDGGAIAISRDHGVSWTAVNSGSSSAQLLRVAYGNGRFVAVSDRTAHASADGVSWATTTLAGTISPSLLIFHAGRFLLPGLNRILTSTDGLAWSARTVALPGYDQVALGSAVAGPDGLYATARLYRGPAATNVILFSSDGFAWEPLQEGEVIPFAYGGGVFLGRGNGIFNASLGAPSRLVNISSLGGVEAQPMFSGFVIRGADKNVLLRSTGPGLATFGVTNAISALASQLYDVSSRPVDGNSPDVLPPESGETAAQAGSRVGGFPQATADRAILVRLRSSAFSWLTFAAQGATGRALAEIYDADRTASASVLSNLSTRVTLTSAQNTLTIGFVVAGERTKTVLLRAIGPSLRRYGVARPVADPTLTLFRHDGMVLAQNDDWGRAVETRQVRQFAGQHGAFALDEGSKDAALAITLAPGSYTAHLLDRTGGGGDILGEIYDVP